MPIPRFYVYVLSRPDGRPFYVGKGQADRVRDHEREARRDCECHKCHIIRKIWRDGGQVQRTIVFRSDDEQVALDREREEIAHCGRENLCNYTDGGDISGVALRGEDNPNARLSWAVAQEVRARYAAGGITAKALAAEYGVHQTKISAVIRNETWHDPTYTPPSDTKTRNVPDRNGVKHPRAIYTAEQVREMRRLYTEERLSLGELMRRYNAPFGTMTKILRNFSYKDPNYTPPSRRETYDRRMKLIPETQAEAQRLHSEGLTYKEIGLRLGCSMSAAWNLCHPKQLRAS